MRRTPAPKPYVDGSPEPQDSSICRFSSSGGWLAGRRAQVAIIAASSCRLRVHATDRRRRTTFELVGRPTGLRTPADDAAIDVFSNKRVPSTEVTGCSLAPRFPVRRRRSALKRVRQLIPSFADSRKVIRQCAGCESGYRS